MQITLAVNTFSSLYLLIVQFMKTALMVFGIAQIVVGGFLIATAPSDVQFIPGIAIIFSAINTMMLGSIIQPQ